MAANGESGAQQPLLDQAWEDIDHIEEAVTECCNVQALLSEHPHDVVRLRGAGRAEGRDEHAAPPVHAHNWPMAACSAGSLPPEPWAGAHGGVLGAGERQAASKAAEATHSSMPGHDCSAACLPSAQLPQG